MSQEVKHKHEQQSLSTAAARNLATTTKTVPQMTAITPRWLLRLLPWVEVESGTYRVNRTKVALNQLGETPIALAAGHEGEPELPESFVDYESDPREYTLQVVQTILRIHTRVADLYNHPINQLQQQFRLTMEGMRERQEWEIINHPDFGLLNVVTPAMRIQPRYGPPTPDDMDNLLSLVWKQPAFFLAHPRAIAAFGRECTWRGTPPPTVLLFGTPFLTWRGVPIIPCDKLEIRGQSQSWQGAGKTDILLMRVGEKEQGVVGLHQTGIPNEYMPSLSVHCMGINTKAVMSYLLSLYFSCAVLTDDALGVLENVEVGYYHNYSNAYQSKVLSAITTGTDKKQPAPEQPAGVSTKATITGSYGTEIKIDGQAISPDDLTPLEEKLLIYLFDRANQFCAYDEIYQNVWHDNQEDKHSKDEIKTLTQKQKRALRRRISTLRKKFNQISSGAGKRYLKNVRRAGYKFIPQ